MNVVNIYIKAVPSNRPALSASTPPSDDSQVSNPKSQLSFMKGPLGLPFELILIDILPASFVPKYLGSEWSYAQVRGLEGKCICAFDRDSPKIIVCPIPLS